MNTGIKTCSKCGIEYPLTAEYFYRAKSAKAAKDGFRNQCRKCMRKKPIPPSVPEGMKYCTKCGEIKPATLEFFHKKAANKDGWHFYCRECRCKHPIPEPITDGFKRCTNCKQEYPATSEFFNAGHTVTHLQSKCRDCEKKLAAQWRKEHPEKKSEYGKKYRQLHSDEINKQTQTRRARKRNVPGIYTVAEIEAQLKRQKGKCYYAACGHCDIRENYQIEHVHPISRPGSRNDMSNIVLSCPHCNYSKNNKLPHEWPEGGRLL